MNQAQKRLQYEIDINKKLLDFRERQLSCAKKNIRFYYISKIIDLKKTIRYLESELIFVREAYNNDFIIDLHGATRYFVDIFLEPLLYNKWSPNGVKIITGKGSKILFKHVKKYLTIHSYNFEYNCDSFLIKF